MTTIGTSYFVSFDAAVKYYRDYEEFPASAVATKLEEGDIHIGKPPIKPGEKLSLNSEGRYVITTKD